MAVTIKASGDNNLWNIEQTGTPVDFLNLPITSSSTTKITASDSVTFFDEYDQKDVTVNVKVELMGTFSPNGKSTLGDLVSSDALSGAKLYVNGSLFEEYSFSTPVDPTVFLVAFDSDEAQEQFLAGDDVFKGASANGSEDNDGVRGYAGDDRFEGNGSSGQWAQQFDGGDGIDTAVFAGKKSEYNISFGNYSLYGDSSNVVYSGPGIEVQSTARVDYTRLFNVEKLEFADGTWEVSGTKLNFADNEATGTLSVTGQAQTGQTLTAKLNASDRDGKVNIAYQWQAKDGGSWGDIEDQNDAQLSAIPAEEVGTVIRVVATTTDPNGGTTEFIGQEMTITDGNKLPTSANAAVTIKEDASLVLTAANIKFADGDKADKLQSVTITSLPAKGSLKLDGVDVETGASISAVDIAANKLVYTPSLNESGDFYASLKYKVSDGKGLSASDYELKFKVTAINDAPTLINPIADQQATEGQVFNFTVSAGTFADVDGDALSYKVLANGKALPKWLKFDANTMTFSGTPLDADSGSTLQVTLTAADKGGAKVSDTFALEVVGVNVAPTVKAIAKPVTATEGKAFSYVLPKGTFTDGDKGDVLTFSSDNLPAWLKIDPKTGKLTGTPGYTAADSAALTVKLTATDKSGLSSSTDLTINLKNTLTIAGTANADVIVAGIGSDNIKGGKGADVLTGGSDKDTFVFAKGDSGQVIGFDQIQDFTKGAVGTGDLIDYSAALIKGGVATAAASDRAAIDASTGVATFAAGSGVDLADALADVANSLKLDGKNGAVKDVVGEFAFFQVNGVGDHFLFVSDGKAGVTADDVVVQLVGVTSISGIDLIGGNLTITA